MASLDTLLRAGLTVEAVDDRLLVQPRHLLTDDLRAEVARHLATAWRKHHRTLIEEMANV